ncbi:MAG TPA: chromate transporter, partial [Planctomycetaceae bacterium]|nr:chromate transporter [Planctomycetaceae bacterium]
AISAAVVGVIVNLAVKFSIHALMPFAGGSFDWTIATAAVVALFLLVRFQVGVVKVILLCGLVGLFHWMIHS